MKKSFFLMLQIVIFHCAFSQEGLVPSPPWTKDLIIYEIAPKSFTSPNGPGSGTFNSTREKIPYLKDLGINAIWLAGYSLAHPDHYYNIWTQYACYNPRVLDPGLGTAEDFKKLIESAHENGIRVFLDVITHAVMNESELVEQHPDWFGEKSPIWHMTQYRWDDKIEALDKWWVETWVRYVTEFGVDGFRLDLSGQRHDLWKEIREKCAEAGHPVVIFSEGAELIPGTYDFTQAYLKTVHGHGVEEFTVAKEDMASYVLNHFGEEKDFSVLITYEDASVERYFTLKDPAYFSLLPDQSDEVSFWEVTPDELTDRHFRLRVNPDKQIRSIQLRDADRGIWHFPTNNRNYVLKKNRLADDEVELIGATGDNNRQPGVYASNEFSCHDNGWEGSPGNKNPFIAEGSRALFGYAALFAPAIPVFMSGEEFNCDFKPLPGLSPHLFGGARPGEGTWLYGNQIDWTQLQKKEKKEMLDDVKKMIAIRKAHSEVICAGMINKNPHIARVAVIGKNVPDLPEPYVQWNDEKAIIVAANPTDREISILLSLMPGETYGWEDFKRVRISDIWNDTPSRAVSLSKNGTVEIPVRIGSDKQERGGIAVYLVSRK